MIRLTLLWLFVGALMVIATRHWYVSLCGLVLLTVFTQHPSMPTSMFGVQGMNPWNATLLVIATLWLLTRRLDGPRAPVSHTVAALFAAYVLLIVLSGLAAVFDASSVQGPAARKLDTAGMAVETIVNPLKYVLLGVMFFDGARTRRRVWMALLAATVSGMLYAVLTFKSIGMRVFTIDFRDARRLTDKLVGLFANDMGELLAFTLWAALIMLLVIRPKWARLLWVAGTATAVPTFVALKSRAGYLALCTIGLVLGTIRWRRVLLLFPLAAIVVVALAPSVGERVFTGVSTDTGEQDWDQISAGRTTNIWPPVLDQIAESALFGHGRYGIYREPCYWQILARERVVPGHPHNSYLEILLDAGLFGLLVVSLCMAGIISASWTLSRQRTDRLTGVLGCVGLVAAISELTAGVAGSSFYPTQSAIPYLCVWGAALAVSAERRAHSMPRGIDQFVRPTSPRAHLAL
jgi:O-antigen ligase